METVALIALLPLLAIERYLEKEVFKYKGLSIPAGEAFRPLNPFFVKWKGLRLTFINELAFYS